MENQVHLRPVSPGDLPVIDGWAATLAPGALSRTRPMAPKADRHDPAGGLFWFVIVVDRRDVGTVWIERLPEPTEPRLGVFLGDPGDLGRGVGQSALRLAVAEYRAAFPDDSISLHVRRSNELAIACYRAVGFKVVDSGLKATPSGEQIPFHTMVLAPDATLRHA